MASEGVTAVGREGLTSEVLGEGTAIAEAVTAGARPARLSGKLDTGVRREWTQNTSPKRPPRAETATSGATYRSGARAVTGSASSAARWIACARGEGSGFLAAAPNASPSAPVAREAPAAARALWSRPWASW